RLELPRQAGHDVAVEAHGDGAIEHARRRGMRNLRGAAEAGGAAEPVVERHRGIGSADHQPDHGAAARGDDDVAPGFLLRRIAHSGLTSTPGPFTSVTM